MKKYSQISKATKSNSLSINLISKWKKEIDTFNGDFRATLIGDFDFVARDHRADEIRRIVLRRRAALVLLAAPETLHLTAAGSENERVALRG